MLKVLFGTRDGLRDAGLLKHYKIHVEANYTREWLYDPMMRRVLTEVDHITEGRDPAEVMFERGQSYLELAGGTHSLMLMQHLDKLFDFARMGPNCYKYLMEIADTKDLRVGVDHSYYEFNDEITKGREIYIENTGTITASTGELFRIGARFT